MLSVLIKGYLKMGAAVCGDPMWDKVFDTADFFMILDTQKMNLAFRNKFA
jgi:putative hemolysin